MEVKESESESSSSFIGGIGSAVKRSGRGVGSLRTVGMETRREMELTRVVRRVMTAPVRRDDVEVDGEDGTSIAPMAGEVWRSGDEVVDEGGEMFIKGEGEDGMMTEGDETGVARWDVKSKWVSLVMNAFMSSNCVSCGGLTPKLFSTPIIIVLRAWSMADSLRGGGRGVPWEDRLGKGICMSMESTLCC
ncbi:hypothetical protein BC829DRAFT_384123 [Chytridium lagenaria]|nr:hypothetical protein BC829DRAFT_384123 [Chytridium lagenaria]